MTELSTAAPQTGYAPLGELQLYYEIHGSGGTPLLLLHGGLFNIDLQFGAVLPALAENRQVIAIDFQGHGRTNDIDRPLATDSLAADVIGLLDHLGLSQVDIFGFSVGGAVALRAGGRAPGAGPPRGPLLDHLPPRRIPPGERGRGRRHDGRHDRRQHRCTPTTWPSRPHPDKLQDLLDKLGAFMAGPDWSDDDIRGIAAPTLITVGDCDMVRLDHAVRFLQLRGGDVNGDFVGVPASHLAVFPGTTHFNGMARTGLVVDVVTTFLDAESTSTPSMMG